MPNERIVRSSTSPVSGSTARPSLHTQPSAMCAAPMQYERSTTSSSGSPAATRTSTRSIAPVSVSTTRAPARASRVATARRCRREQHRRDALHPRTSAAAIDARLRRARPRRARSALRSRPPRCGATSGPHRPRRIPSRADSQRAYGAGVRTATSPPTIAPSMCTVAVAADRARGDGRALRSEADAVLARVHDPHGATVLVREIAARRRARNDDSFPPNAPPFASGDAGSPPGRAPRRVGLEVRGLDPARREAHTALGQRRQRERRALVDGRAPALHLAGEPRARASRATPRTPTLDAPTSPFAATAPQRARLAARCRRQNPRSPQRHLGADSLRDTALELGAVAAAASKRRDGLDGAASLAARVDRLVDRLPAGAPAQVRGERAVDVGAAVLAPRRAARPRARGSRACRSRTATRRSRRTRRRADPAAPGRARRAW